MKQTLLSALGATSGVVCLVGAGGKKSTMYALAAAHPGRVLLSSTSHMYAYPPDKVDQVVSLSDQHDPVPSIGRGRVIALAGATDTPKRVGGLAPSRILEIFKREQFDLCVLKADGARARWIKSPGGHEPIVPAFADVVIPVVSALVVGRPLDEKIAHKPERLTKLIGINPGENIEVQHVAALLAHPNGSLKGTGDARVIPLINMVDDSATLDLARDIAERALALTDAFDRVVLASMKEARLCEIVYRE